jgi:hypothetical protein
LRFSLWGWQPGLLPGRWIQSVSDANAYRECRILWPLVDFDPTRPRQE